MSWCYLFSGQGAQKIGYLEDVIQKYDDFAKNIEVAEKITNYPLETVFRFGPQEKLDQTIYAQLFLFIYGYTLAKLIKRETNFELFYLAGLSIGEYTALCYADVFNFESGIKLVFNRANLMHKSCIAKKGTMFALIGADIETVEKFCHKLSEYGIVQIANYNAQNQVVIGCEERLREKILIEYKNFGIKRAIGLRVEGAFHTSLMEYAAQTLVYYIDNTTFYNSKIPVISNTTAKEEVTIEEIKENLKMQIISPVRWYESILHLKNKGVKNFVELGPGGILTDLVKKTYTDANVYKIETLTDLENIVTHLKDN